MLLTLLRYEDFAVEWASYIEQFVEVQEELLIVGDFNIHIKFIYIVHIAPIAQLVSALDLVTWSVQVEGSILTAGKRLSLKI